MKHLLVVAFCLVAVKNGSGHRRYKDNPIVTTEQGDVLGSVRINRKGGEFYSFMSIPYAKPPVGELRFMVSTVYNFSDDYYHFDEAIYC